MISALHSKQRTTLILFLVCAVLAFAFMGKYIVEVADTGLSYGDFPVFKKAADRVFAGDFSAVYSFSDLHVISSVGEGGQVNHAFVYPPILASALGVFGPLSMNSAYVLWLVLQVCLFLGALHLYLRGRVSNLTKSPEGKWIYAMLLLATPLLYTSIFTAQISGLLTGLLLLGLYFAPKRPVLAGVCLGLMCIKPQYALLVGCVMLMRGHWRVVFAACVTALLCAVLATFHLGYERWGEWVALLPAFMDTVVNDTPQQFAHLVLSPFYSLRLLLGFSYGASMTVQLLISAMLLLGAFALFRKSDKAREDLRVAWLLIATLLISPHMFVYDLLLLSTSMLILLHHTWKDEGRLLLSAVLCAGVLLSPFIQATASPSHYPFSLLATACLLAYTSLLYMRSGKIA